MQTQDSTSRTHAQHQSKNISARPCLPDGVERLALLGCRLFPTSSTTRAACFEKAHLAATANLDQLTAWAKQYPGSNWRMVLEGSGWWALDCDAPSADHDADGIAALAKLVQQHGELPERPMIRTGGGGLVLFFQHRGEPIAGRTGWPCPGLDPRRGLLSVTVPPSLHHRTRRPYRWITAPWELTPPPAPSWLLRAVAPSPEPERPAAPHIATTDRARRRLFRAMDAITAASPGTRNDRLNREAYALARYVAAGKLGEVEAIEALYAAGRQAGLDHAEVRATLRSGFAAGLRQPMETL